MPWPKSPKDTRPQLDRLAPTVNSKRTDATSRRHGLMPAGTAAILSDSISGGVLVTPVTFSDAVFAIYNSIDTNKIAMFDCSAITSPNTRVFIFQDLSGTIPLLEKSPQIWTGNVNVFDSGGSTIVSVGDYTAGTTENYISLIQGNGISINDISTDLPGISWLLTSAAVGSLFPIPGGAGGGLYALIWSEASGRGVVIDPSFATAAKRTTLKFAQTLDRIITFPDATGTLALIDLAQTWSALQTFKDTTFKLVDDADSSKTAVFSLGGASANADLTLAWNGTADRTVTLPNATGLVPTVENAATITGAWTVDASTSVPFVVKASAAGTADGLGFEILDTSGFYMEIDTAGALTANRCVIVPDASGTLVLTTGAQNLASKTIQTSCNIQCNTASNGVPFQDQVTSGKKLRFVMSGASANNHTVTVANTGARDYKLDDHSGTVVVAGNTTSASGVLGISDLTGQTGNIGATTLLTSSANSSGMFRVSFYVKTTTAGSAGSLVKVTLAYNDGSAQTADVLLTNAVATPAAPAVNHDLTVNNNASYGSLTVYCAASNAITFTTTGTYNTNPQYTLRARIEQLT